MEYATLIRMRPITAFSRHHTTVQRHRRTMSSCVGNILVFAPLAFTFGSWILHNDRLVANSSFGLVRLHTYNTAMMRWLPEITSGRWLCIEDDHFGLAKTTLQQRGGITLHDPAFYPLELIELPPSSILKVNFQHMKRSPSNTVGIL